MTLQISIRPRLIALMLGGAAVYLVIQSLLTEFLVVNVIGEDTHSVPKLLLDLFSVNLESSIPTWYSTILLFVASVVLFLITAAKYQTEDRLRHYWFGLAVGFFYLSMDEGAVIHEAFSDAMQAAFDTTGFLTFGWQIVAVPLVVLVGLIYLRFLIRLPGDIRTLFILSGAIYLGGAFIVEGISANQWAVDQGEISFGYLAIATVEECFEMLGVVLFIYALCRHGVQEGYQLTVLPVSAADKDETPVEDPPSSRTRMVVVGVMVLAAVTLLADFALMGWAERIGGDPEVIEVTQGQIYAVFSDAFASDDVLVTYATRPFDWQMESSRQYVASMLNSFDDLIVINLMTSNSALVLAGDSLDVTRDELTNLLHESGETQFIIFDKPLLMALVGAS